MGGSYPVSNEPSCILLLRGGRFFFQPGGDDRLQEGHHRAELRAKLLDGVVLFAFAGRQEIRAALLGFLDPFFRVAAIANFCDNSLYFVPRLLRDDAWPGTVVALLGRFADRITHVAQPAAIDQVYDELQ